MSKKLVLAACLLAGCLAAQGGIYTFSGPFADNGSGPGVIPDNNLIGLTDAHTLSGLGSSISSVLLTVNLSGIHLSDLTTAYIRLGNSGGSPSVNLVPSLGDTMSVDLTTSSPSFQTLDPNTTWTIFFADSVNLNETTLTSWSLNITAVPEPVNVALGIFAGVFVVGGLCRTQPVRNRLQRCWVGVNHWLDAV